MALRRGGLRWAYVDADRIVWLRETPEESVLVLLARAAGSRSRSAHHCSGLTRARRHETCTEGQPSPQVQGWQYCQEMVRWSRCGSCRGIAAPVDERRAMASVELDGINKVYDNGFHAVQDLSIEVADGEFLVLVGPSGCGKSTALRMVAGLEDISSGELRIGGRRVNELEPQQRDIAMVFQSYALYPHMTVADNIAYGLKLRKMPKDEMNARIKKAADMLELTPLLDRKPKQLSGGQRQRVAMGRAIVREPQVFLMDEPLSNLDAKLRVQMRAEISAVVRSLNTTTLYVTHDQTEAMTMGDRMAVMKAGHPQPARHPGRVLRHTQQHLRRAVRRLAADEPGDGRRRGRRGPPGPEGGRRPADRAPRCSRPSRRCATTWAARS